MAPQVSADPYPFPSNGELELARTALMVIDMQADFCSPGGYLDASGYDVAPLRAPIEPLARVIEAAHAAGIRVVHTRQGYRADLADFAGARAERARARGSLVGQPGPLGRILVRGEPGWQIVPELAPSDGDIVVDKTANGAFYGTDLDPVLRVQGIDHLIFGGNTIDVCVHTTLREANDRGYDCLLLADCCGAVSPELHRAAVEMVKVEGGVFGCVATSADLLASLGHLSGPLARDQRGG